MIVDEAEIYVRGGRGGDGCLSFRREKFIPRGGPDGGDGGIGGNVIALADLSVETLLDFSGRHHWKAENGRPGMGKNRTGHGGNDLILALPVGTLLYDRDTGVVIKDLSTAGEPVCIARGGKGGRGNARFARADHQVPREFELGEEPEERWLRLELKLMADVGIVGLPNAGKSTLLSRVSKARPKIADYPFTTLKPCLGIVELGQGRRLTMADIPGLIEGAHEGAGLGDTFLKHIERTRAILHVVDVGSEGSTKSACAAYYTIRRELEKYSPVLAEKEEVVIANKIDLTGGMEAFQGLRQAIGPAVLPVSAISGKGVVEMSERLWTVVTPMKQVPAAEPELPVPPHRAVPPNRKDL